MGVPLRQATTKNLFATFSGKPPTALWVTGGMGKKLDTMNTAYCEVAVDTETGEVEILRFGVVADPGKIMRLTSLESQIDQVMYSPRAASSMRTMFSTRGPASSSTTI